MKARRLTKLLELCILGLGSDEDRDVRVGVPPQLEESLIGRFGLHGVALHGVGSADLEVRKCADGFVEHNPAVVKNFLKLCCGFAALTCNKIGFSAHINGVQIGPIVKANRWQAE